MDRDGKIAAVRCRASLDMGVEAVFMGTAPGYRLEERAQTGKTACAGAEAVERRRTLSVEVPRGAAASWSVFWRREFSGLPVYVDVKDGYVKRTAPMNRRQFRRYLETCKRLGFRLDKGSSRWRSCSHLQRYKPATAGRTPLMDRLIEAVAAYLCLHRSVGLLRFTPGVGSPR